jgi:Uma2 family endonuclease
MMEQPRETGFTAEAFVAWAAGQPQGRYELMDGRVVAMAPDEALEVTDPIVVVEILSPSSRGIDTGLKLDGYFRLASLRHYLVVNTEGRVVLHHRRDETGAIGVRILHEGTLRLDPPGLAVEIGDLFAAS